MKRVLALFLVLICMLSLVACDKATGSGEPVRSGDVSDMPEIDKNVFGEKEQTQQAIIESISWQLIRSNLPHNPAGVLAENYRCLVTGRTYRASTPSFL